jgi:hypothetical protein
MKHEDRRNAYCLLLRKPEGNRPYGRCKHRWKMVLKCVFKNQDGKGMGWIDLAQDLEK